MTAPQFPAYQPQPQPPRQRSHGLRNGCLIALAAAGGLVVLIIVAVAIGTAASSKGTAAAPGSAGPAAAPMPGTGQVARDGDFAFTIERESCGTAAARAVDAGGIGEHVPAGARECIFTIRVTDDKAAAQTFFDSSQYAYDAAGRQFSADTAATIYLKGDQDSTQVNPGITIVAEVPFQIPAADKITRLVLHDSAFSGGVTVRA